MDISFHYFAIKFISRMADFTENDAQLIATYSQMVDNFDYASYWNCTNVPDYIKTKRVSDDSDLYYPDAWIQNFWPVQTGFMNGKWTDIFDYLKSPTKAFQGLTYTPFHFIYNNESQIKQSSYRVHPTIKNGNSLMWALLISAHDDYIDSLNGMVKEGYSSELYKKKTLIKIGLLLHIWADTYAHQMFSGSSDWVNNVTITKIINNNNGHDETSEYKESILDTLRKYFPSITPMIGHTFAGHIPDLTHLYFAITYKDNDEVKTYSRSNTSEFIKCCKEIYTYLVWCRKARDTRCELTAAEDQAFIPCYELLSDCFLTDISKCESEKAAIDQLKPIWESHTSNRKDIPNIQGITFNYDIDALKKGFEGKGAVNICDPENNACEVVEGNENERRDILPVAPNDDFYLFNINAEEVLISLYGSKPREKY